MINLGLSRLSQLLHFCSFSLLMSPYWLYKPYQASVALGDHRRLRFRLDTIGFLEKFQDLGFVFTLLRPVEFLLFLQPTIEQIFPLMTYYSFLPTEQCNYWFGTLHLLWPFVYLPSRTPITQDQDQAGQTAVRVLFKLISHIPLLVRRRSSVQIKSWPLEQWV